MSKLSYVVKDDVVKKTVYDNLAAKVNNINPIAFALKTKYQTDKTEFEKKISDFVKKTKLTELENKIPDVSRTQKLVSLKRNLLIIIMTNILLLQSLIL